MTRRLFNFLTGRIFGKGNEPASKDAGSALIMTISLMVLLGMTSMIFMTSSTTSIRVSKTGMDFHSARQASSIAAADAIQQMNTGALAETNFPLVGNPRGVNESILKGQWKWWVTKVGTTTERLYVQGSAKSVGAAGSVQTFNYPLRSALVGSYRDGIADVKVYGEAASSAFKYALAVTDDNGDGTPDASGNPTSGLDSIKATSVVTGEVGLFGNVNLKTNGTVLKAYSFSDSAMVAGGTIVRSALSARLDKKLLKVKADNCATQTYTPQGVNYAAQAALYCQTSADFAAGSGSSGTGVATVFVHGPVTFSGSIGQGTSSQIHVYSDTAGNIDFAASGTPTYVHLFAPFAHCRVPAGTIDLRGSIACRYIEIAGTFTNVAPLPDDAATPTPGAASKRIYYLESADFSDSLNP